jgi:hypothetical protein
MMLQLAATLSMNDSLCTAVLWSQSLHVDYWNRVHETVYRRRPMENKVISLCGNHAYLGSWGKACYHHKIVSYVSRHRSRVETL